MTKRAMVSRVLVSIILIIALPVMASGEQFRITIMQDQAGTVEKYRPVLDYLAKKGINASFEFAKDYPAATVMFGTGKVDAMFSGSGVAGVLIIKDLAVPLVRPVDLDGHSTYWAVIIASKNSPKYTGSPEYFKGKKVVFTSLASSGEFYFHTLPGSSQASATIRAASHGEALDIVNKGEADIAIVKNRVWDDTKTRYPNLVQVGEDKGENPDSALIISKALPHMLADKISAALLAVKNDTSPEAQHVKQSMKIKGFIKTTGSDFGHTLDLLKKAGVTKSYNFAL